MKADHATLAIFAKGDILSIDLSRFVGDLMKDPFAYPKIKVLTDFLENKLYADLLGKFLRAILDTGVTVHVHIPYATRLPEDELLAALPKGCVYKYEGFFKRPDAPRYVLQRIAWWRVSKNAGMLLLSSRDAQRGFARSGAQTWTSDDLLEKLRSA